MPRIKRTIRRTISLFWTALTLVTVTLAVMVGLGKLLLPYSERFQPQLEQRLSEVIQSPVRIKRFSGDWKAFGPRLELEGLQIFSAEGGDVPLLVIDRAAVDVRPLAMLFPQKAAYEFTIIGADLKFVRDSEGNLEVSGVGLKSSSSGTMNLSSLSSLGEIRLEKFDVAFDDAQLEMQAELREVTARLQFHKESVAVEFQAQIPELTGQAGTVNGSAELIFKENKPVDVTGWLEASVPEFDSVAQMFPAKWTVQAGGQGEIESWIHWSAESGVDVLGKVDHHDLNLQLHPEGEAVFAEHVAGYFNFKRQAKREWQLALTQLQVSALGREWQADAIQIERSLTVDRQMWVVADGGDIDFARPIVQGLMKRYRPADDKWVLADLRGQMDHIELLLGNGWQPLIIKAKGSNLDLKKWKNWPVIEGLDASIEFVNGTGDLAITSPGATITWPKVFKETVLIGEVDCPMQLERRGRGEWKVWSDECHLENETLAANTNLYLEGNEKRPYMKAEAKLERVDIGGLGPYWADVIMSQEAVAWLRRGLLAGTVNEGAFSIDGDLDDWPFKNDEGLFTADFGVTNGKLDYTTGWPLAEDVAARVVIRNSILEVLGASGRIGSMPLHQADARVHMRRPVVVELDFRGAGDAAALRQFTIDSPLDELMNTDISPMLLTGPATVHGKLKVDRSDPLGHFRINGTIGLENATLQDDRWDLMLENINGELAYSENGIGGKDIAADFKGYPAIGEIQAGPGYAGDNSFRAVISGKFPAQAILSSRFEGLHSLAERMQGEADWRIETYAQRGAGSEEGSSWLVLDSDLVGIESQLPAPLRKDANDELPLHMTLPLTGGEPNLILDLAGLVSVHTIFDRESFGLEAANVVFGTERAAEAEPGFLRMAGSVDDLNIDGWIDFFGDNWQSSLPGTGAVSMDKLALEVGTLHLMDRDFDAVKLTAFSENERWKVAFDSKMLAGSLHLPSASQNALTVDFDVLHLPLPQTQGMQLSTDPRNVPTLHLYARDLRYGNLRLGETRLEAFPKGDGLHFESVESTSANVAVRASGDWFVTDEGQRSKFLMTITSESLAAVLESISVNTSMRGGQTLVEMDAWWPGAPSAFAMENVSGTLKASLIDGHIPSAQPGAGRILGLLSLQALPRRLALDFRDVFASGLNFDQANGSFTLVDGIAQTDDLEVLSPAAVIKVTGATDFNKKAYDQIIVIEPGVGSTLPIIGAITGGPGGAAAGLALQGLLNKPLGRVVQVQYSLTGPWSEPVMEAISAQQVPAEAPVDVEEETSETEPVATIETTPVGIR